MFFDLARVGFTFYAGGFESDETAYRILIPERFGAFEPEETRAWCYVGKRFVPAPAIAEPA